MTSTPPAVELSDAGHRYGGHIALQGVNLSVQRGERVALLGPSGAGKSTLLGLVAGSLAPTSGRVTVLGQDRSAATPRALRRLQRRIGFVSQRLDLIEQVRVLHNVNAGRLGQWSALRAAAALVWPQADEAARVALRRVGLEWAVHERTERLSGGERQRVALARLLLQQPELVVADEPVSSLDPARAAETLQMLGAMPGTAPSTAPSTLLVSLHQPYLAAEHCTRVVGLRAGQVVFDLPVEELTPERIVDLYELLPADGP